MLPFILGISLLLIIAQSILENAETFSVHQNSGFFTSTITADPEPNSDPSKYGICGFSLREMIYTKKTYDCGCRINCYGRRECSWCDTEFRLKANAIKITFCAFDEPTRKVTKIFESGNTQSGKWRDIICPQGMIVQRYAARFGKDGEISLGLNGFQLQCITPQSDKRSTVSDNYTFPLSATSNNSAGTAATGAAIKYQQNGMITGIKVFFDPYNIVISEAQVSYGIYTLIGSPIIKTIQKVVNQNTQMTARNTEQNFTIPYVSKSNFANIETAYNDFKFETSVILQPPALNPTSKSQESVFYIKVYSDATFKNNVTVTYTPHKTMVVSLPWCTQVVGVSQVIEQFAKVPYTIKLTFINQVSRAIVKTVIVTGNWEGFLRAPITTTITYPQIPGCKND